MELSPEYYRKAATHKLTVVTSYEGGISNLSPEAIAMSRQHLVAKNFKVTDAIMGGGVWDYMIRSEDFTKLLDPLQSVSDLTSGKLASLFGMTLWSDINIVQTHNRFVPFNEILLCGSSASVELHVLIKFI